MLAHYKFQNETIDSLDLKMLLLTHGVSVSPDVYSTIGNSRRLSADPYECNGLVFEDQTIVHLADLKNNSPFKLITQNGKLRLQHNSADLADVTLPEPSAFYRQTTSRGVPYRGLAVLEGVDMMAFPYLWPCQYAVPNMTCKFCHTGYFTELQRSAKSKTPVGDVALNTTPQDVAEAIHYAVRMEGTVNHIEITGGSTFADSAETKQMTDVLLAIKKSVGLEHIKDGIHIYTTPPKNPRAIDPLFEAGADRVSCNLEVWDETHAKTATPGKHKWTGKQRHLDTLLHIANTHGKNRACCTFILGLEPLESFLAGAEFCAANGIVPLATVLMMHGLPDYPRPVEMNLNFFRAAKRGLAKIYDKYETIPPGRAGSHVSIARNTWNHRAELAA